MKKTYIKKGFFAYIVTFLLVASSIAQTITTGAVTPSSVCAGSSVSVAFTTASVPAGTTYTVQLSDESGTFTSPIATATGTASPISVAVPVGTEAGPGYKARVISETPALTGSESAVFAIMAVSADPTVVNKNYTVGDPVVGLELSVTGTGLLWYADPTTGTGSATAPAISTAAAGTTSYYVSQTVAGSCESARVKIDVIVTAAACVPPAAPVVVNKNYTVGDAPVSLALSVTGTNLLWYTAATGGTGSAAAPTISTASAGTTSYWVTQSATVGSCESPRAQIDVIVSAAACVPPAAPAVVNKNYTVGDVPVSLALSVTGTNLLWYTAATGGTGSAAAPTISTAAAGTKSYWVTQSATVGSCESPRAQIDVIVSAAACVPPAAPAVVNKNYTVGDAPVSLALSVTGTNLLWYTAATGGTGSATVPTISTAAAGTTSYWVTQSATVGSCESPRAQIDVIVSAAACVPPAAPAVVNKNYTVGDAPVSLALSVTGTNLLWYTAATGGTGSAAAPTISTAAAGTKSYWVTQSATVGSCESPRAKIDVIVSAAACVPPAAPIVVNKNYTVGDAPVSLALSVTGSNLLWYTAATGGTGSATIPAISTAAPGTKSYWVTQSATAGSCESPRAKIDVIVTTAVCVPPSAPVVVNKNYTVGDAPVSLALSVTGTNLLWYTAATGGTGSATVPTISTAAEVTKSYWVTQSSTAGSCESPRAKIDVVVTCGIVAAPVVANKNYTVGDTPVSLTLSVIGKNLLWYAAATGGTGSATVPTISTASAGTKSYWVTQSATVGSCESPRAKIDVVVSCAIIAKPIVSAIPAVCENTTVAASVFLNAVTPKINLEWYNERNGGTKLPTAPSIEKATNGIKTFYVLQNINGCKSERDSVSIDVKVTPAKPTVTAVPYCKDVTNAVALTATGTSLKWYATEIGGATGSTTAPKPSTATVGTTSFYVSQSATYGTLVCESLRAKLDVTINPLPSTLPTFADSICQERGDKTYTFAASPTDGNSVAWYLAATGGNKEASTPTINLKNVGETTYYMVQVTSKNCESPVRASNKIRVKALPGLPGIDKPVIEYCQFLPAQPLTATNQTNASLNWFGNDSNGGNSSNIAPTPSTQNGGTTSFYVAQTLEGCLGERAKIDVQVNTTPLPNVLTPAVAYCQNETPAPLAAEGNGLKWYLTEDDASPRTTPLVPYTLKVEDYSFYVTQTGVENKCESPKAEIKIHIKALPSAVISGNSSIALGGTATITLKFTGDGPWKYVLSNGTTDSTDQATKNIQVTPSTTTTYVVTQISNSCGKGTPIGSAVVTVLVPTITSGNPTVSEVCAGKSFGVPFSQSGDFPSTNTFKVQISLVNEDAGFYTIPSVAASNMITATFPDSTVGGNYFIRVISSGPNADFTVKGSVSAIGIVASPLPVATITGTQTILIGDSGELKVEITGKSPWSFNLNNGTTDSLITSSSTPYSFRMAPRVTTTYTISSVTNVCGAGKGVGSARIQVDPILGIEPPVTDWVKVYPTLIETQQCTVELATTISPKDAKIQVLNMNGTAIHEQAINQKLTGLDFSRYPSGLYLLRVQNGNLNSVIRVMKP